MGSNSVFAAAPAAAVSNSGGRSASCPHQQLLQFCDSVGRDAGEEQRRGSSGAGSYAKRGRRSATSIGSISNFRYGMLYRLLSCSYLIHFGCKQRIFFFFKGEK